jgi:hypothetical protein
MFFSFFFFRVKKIFDFLNSFFFSAFPNEASVGGFVWDRRKKERKKEKRRFLRKKGNLLLPKKRRFFERKGKEDFFILFSTISKKSSIFWTGQDTRFSTKKTE